MNDRLDLHLLGGLQIRYNDNLVTDLVSRKAEALLVYVASNQRTHRREVLADLFWSQRAQSQATTNLRVALTSLRQKLKPFLTIDRYTVAINHQQTLWVDTLAFEALLRDFTQQADHQGELATTVVGQIEQALSLYGGEFLLGTFISEAPSFEEWVRVERERLHILALKAVQALSLHYVKTRQSALGINAVERWLHFDPLNEEAHHILMLLLASAGHRSAVIAHYERVVALFREELGSKPSAVLEQLYQQVLDQRVEPAQLNKHSTIGQAPRSGPGTALPLPNNLEAALSPIVGREPELAQILQRIQTPACRLLTLSGIGGVGKTRLALEAATQLAHLPTSQALFPDGIFWVRLEHVENDALLLSALAQAIHYAFQGSTAPTKQLLEFLRHRQLLLVLDNVEQLVGHSEFLLQILHMASGIKLLVTSRTHLDFQGEWLIEVNGLPYPAATAQADWQNYPAPQLFIQCATALVANFAPHSQRAAIIQICQMMEGLPLGIQLAAASVRTFTCQQILTALQQNLDFLSSTMRNLPLRHRSLRAIFEYSWLRLTATEKQAFQGLAIFEGSFTVEAATAVAAIPAAVLLALRDKSLVYTMPSKATGTAVPAGEPTEQRYRLHAILHQYAAEKLAGAETSSALLQQHAHYYSAWVSDQTPALYTAQAAQVSGRMSHEIENIRKSWQTAVTFRLLRLLECCLLGLIQYYKLRGLFQEGQALLTIALARLAPPDAPPSRDTAQNSLAGRLFAHKAELLVESGVYEEAITCAQSGVVLAQAGQDYLGEAMGYLQWGAALHRQAAYAASDQKLLQALAIAETTQSSKLMADIYLCLARNRFYLGDYGGGQIRHEQAIHSYQASSDLVDELATHNSLAMLYLFAGDYAKAQTAYEWCLHAYQQIDNRPAIGLMLNNLGALATLVGQYQDAQRYYEESLAIRRRVGGRQSEALVLANLALIAHQTNTHTKALDYSQAALQLSIELGERDTEAYARLCLGHALAGLARWQEAAVAYQVALTARRQAGQQTQALEPLAGLARVALAQGQLRQATAYIDELLPQLTYQTYAGIVELIRIYLTCYQVLNAVGDERATALLRMGYTILQERAAKITSADLRQSYLQIAVHAEVCHLYETNTAHLN